MIVSMPAFNLTYFAAQLQKLQPDCFFVQIGSMDGKSQDPIYNFVRQYRWKGLLVEPMKDHFESLKLNYAGHQGLIFENLAITDKSGPGIMYRLPTHLVKDETLPRWGMGASSFFMDRNALAWKEIKPHIVEEAVDCMTLHDLLEKHQVKKIDLLQIDAEGYDYRILRQLNFEKFHPHIIHLEIVNLPKSEVGECKQLLDKYDYLHAKNGYNLLAVAKPTTKTWFQNTNSL